MPVLKYIANETSLEIICIFPCEAYSQIRQV